MESGSGKSITHHLVAPAMDADADQAWSGQARIPLDASWVWRYSQHPLDEVGIVQIVRIAQRGGNRSAAWLPGPT